jgi:hypothetical protein
MLRNRHRSRPATLPITNTQNTDLAEKNLSNGSSTIGIATGKATGCRLRYNSAVIEIDKRWNDPE